MISCRAGEGNEKHIAEAFRRCKFKFPGVQKIVVSKKWGFTPHTKPEYERLREEGRLVRDGIMVTALNDSGPLRVYKRLVETDKIIAA